MSKTYGLVLSGGGARGAYQAGVLKAVAEISVKNRIKNPFQILAGVSAGSINAAFLAAQADDFLGAAQRLCDLWSNLKSEQVFKTDAVSLGKIGLSWVGELSLGGLTSASAARSLLDTSPLAQLVAREIDFSKISQHVDRGHLKAVALTAMEYNNSETVTFVQGLPNTKLWQRSRRHAELCELSASHVMASSAIPILFMPGKVGHRYFGDGCIRNQMPLSPALHLGSEAVFAIGVRQWKPKEFNEQEEVTAKQPSIARIVNVLLNSVLLDSVETDLERLQKINAFLKLVPEDLHEGLNFKAVPYLSVHPSEDIGAIAATMSSRLPRVVRYLLKGLGPLEDASEIISYLLFEPKFCRTLIELGYADAYNLQDKITNFLLSPSL
jgi:NTE family protein